jgi:hypothetical protein
MYGSTTPRLWTRPLVKGLPGPCGCGCALTKATSKGFSIVDYATDVLGIRFLPWQRWLLIHAMELKPDGRFRFRTVLVMVGRQNGKTTTLEVKNLWKMFVLQVPLIIGTAQDLTAAEETWEHALEMVEGCPELAAEVKHVDKTNGKKALRLTNGSRWLVKAATRKGGRSFSADDINLDELREHLNWDSWSAVTKTMMARPKAQAWCCSNAGDARSVVLNSLQAKARAADPNGSLGLFEWSAPDDTRCTCERIDPDPHTVTCQLRDPRLWAMANPAYGYTITEEAMLSALETDPEPVFLTECLCVRVADLTGGIIPAALWATREDVESEAVGRVGLAIDASPDLKSAAIAITGVRSDGKRHWQLLEHQPGSDWVVPKLVELRDGTDEVDKLEFGPVGVDPSGPAGALIADLGTAGFEVVDCSGRSLVQAWGTFSKDVKDDLGKHLGQEGLEAAIRDARAAPSGDVERFSRKKSTGDICPLVAVTISDHAEREAAKVKPSIPLVAWR